MKACPCHKNKTAQLMVGSRNKSSDDSKIFSRIRKEFNINCKMSSLLTEDVRVFLKKN